MSSQPRKYLLMKVSLVAILLAASVVPTILVGHRLMGQWPISERDKAIQNSIHLWGTQPLTSRQVSHGPVKPSGGGPYRQYTFRFTDKFRQAETVSGNFLLKDPPPQEVKIWQKRSTGDVMLPQTYNPGDGTIGPILPYSDGISAQDSFGTLGFLLTAITAVALALVAYFGIYRGIIGRLEESRRDRQIKQQAAAATSE